MPAYGADLANAYQHGLSIEPQADLAVDTNGTGVDFQDCGPEVTCVLMIGDNTGDDSTTDVKLQESDDDGASDAYADITGATMTQVAGDSENQIEVKTFFNRAKRYVRAVVDVGGTSPTVDVSVSLHARKISY